MAAETKREVSGLELLRQPATLALARYLNDLRSVLGFKAYLWCMIVKADYSHGDPTKFPKPGDVPPPESAVAQMDIHSAVLGEMVFCRGVNSFLTYLADLMTLIYEKYPQKAPVKQADDVPLLHRASYGGRPDIRPCRGDRDGADTSEPRRSVEVFQ